MYDWRRVRWLTNEKIVHSVGFKPFKPYNDSAIFQLFLGAGRAKRKIDELAHLLDVAKMNYRQLGGVLDEDQKKHEEERESAR